MSNANLARHTDTAAVTVRPHVDVLESTEAFRLVVDLPGVEAEALAVDLDKDVLRIGGRATDPVVTDRPVLYERSFTVPAELDADGMTASLTNGVLTVDLPKAASARPRRIPVTSDT